MKNLMNEFHKGAYGHSYQVTKSGVPKPTDALSGEFWELKKERIRSSSAYGKLPGWDLRSVSKAYAILKKYKIELC